MAVDCTDTDIVVVVVVVPSPSSREGIAGLTAFGRVAAMVVVLVAVVVKGIKFLEWHCCDSVVLPKCAVVGATTSSPTTAEA